MTESRITTWQQPDDLWAYRLEDAVGGTVAYSQHGFHSRRLALVRARQVALERTLEPRRYEETVEL